MPIDVSILSQFKPQQPEPLLNTLAQFETIRGARQQQEMNALQMQRAKRELAEQEFEDKLYENALTPEGRVDYSVARRQAVAGGRGRLVPVLSEREQKEAKARLEAQTAQVKLQADQSKLLSDKITQFADAARFIETPQAARAWNAALHQDNITGPWFKSIGVTPEQGDQEIAAAAQAGDLAGWRSKVLEGKEKITQRLRDQSDLQRAMAAATKKASPTTDVSLYDTGAEGRRVQTDSISYIQNVVAELQELGRTDLAGTILKQYMDSAMALYAGLPPKAAELEALRRHPELRAVKERLAELSATRVSVSTGDKAGVEYAKTFGAEVAKQDIKLKEAAEAAPRLAADAQRILAALKQKDLITGFGADFRLSVAKALNLVGADNATTISNTENLRATLATQTLSAIKESNLGTGQGFTNQDREFLQDAKSGRIEFDRNSLERLADLAYRAAQESAKRWNARRAKMPAEARDAMGLDEDVVIKPLKEDTMAKPKALSEGGARSEGYPVTAPNGKTYFFPTQRAADEYKRMIEQR